MSQFRRTVVCVLAIVPVFALTSISIADDKKPAFEVRSGAAVRTARAPRLDVLLQRAGKRAELRSGSINELGVPDNLKPGTAPADDAGTTTLNRFPVTANAPAVQVSVEGYSNNDNATLLSTLVTPPDTNGDVGLTHYVQYVNLGWEVFDKTGASVAGPFAGNSFFAGFGGFCESTNAGDPVVLYDHLAGRWLFSQFTGQTTDGHQCFALSDGEDPTGPYTLFDYNVSPGAFNDYPKIGLWPNGYYMTTHEFTGGSFSGVNVNVFDRAAMLTGSSGFVQYTGTGLLFCTIPGNLEGAAVPGSVCNYLVHATDADAFFSPPAPADSYRIYEVCPDFAVPANSTLAFSSNVVVPEFNVNLCGFNRNCIDQNSGSSQLLDPLAGFTMFRMNLRHFPADGVLKTVITNNVNVGTDRAGVLWAGLDIDPVAGTAAISDTGMGVIDFADNLNRWMGSGAVDQDGNIGIGYTRAGPGQFPSVYYTVHERGVDAAGAVQAESACINGTGSHEGANRWADYASTSVDPVDGCTFWHTNEYVETTGSFSWTTRICSFGVSSCGVIDDADGDSIPDSTDNCPDTPNTDQQNSDTDSHGDVCDNCTLVDNEDQCNTNAGTDNFGNACDADIDNNGIVNTFDLGQMRTAFGPTGMNDSDLDCNGVVNTFDLSILRAAFGAAPGPSGL